MILGGQFAQEFFLVDQEAFVGALADGAVIIGDRNLEGQLAAIYAHQNGFGVDGFAYQGSGIVGQVHADAHAGGSVVQAGIDDFTGGFFHQGQHGRGGINIQGPAAHGFSRVGVKNGFGGFAYRTNAKFFHTLTSFWNYC